MNPTAFQIGNFEVRWYGILIALGVIVAILLASYNCKKKDVDFDIILDGFFVAFPAAIIGASPLRRDAGHGAVRQASGPTADRRNGYSLEEYDRRADEHGQVSVGPQAWDGRHAFLSPVRAGVPAGGGDPRQRWPLGSRFRSKVARENL